MALGTDLSWWDVAVSRAQVPGGAGWHLDARSLRPVIDDVAAFRVAHADDDAVEAVVDFEGGAIGTIEATRFATGRKNAFTWEINGSKGSLRFDLERLNELEVHLAGSEPGARAQGFRTVLVSEPDHPFWEHWWPQGHIIGWEHTFTHQIRDFLCAIRDGEAPSPSFDDGLKVQRVLAAVEESAARRSVVTGVQSGKWTLAAPTGRPF